MVRKNKHGVTVSGDDLNNLKAALRKILRPAAVPDGHAQCPGCKKVLQIRTAEQRISGTCDPCWDKLFAEPKPVTEPELKGEGDDEEIPF